MIGVIKLNRMLKTKSHSAQVAATGRHQEADHLPTHVLLRAIEVILAIAEALALRVVQGAQEAACQVTDLKV